MENIKEAWKDIRDWEGIYQVSDRGRVRSLPRIITTSDGRRRHLKGHMLTGTIHHTGIYVVALRDGTNNKSKTADVGNLVATMFIPRPKNAIGVIYIDCDRSNINVENLMWGTRALICNYRKRVQVRCVETGDIYMSMSHCDRCHGWSTGTTHNAVVGNRSTHDYTFEIIPKDIEY